MAIELSKQLRAALHPRLRPGSRVLVAVSGGPDSVALAHALRALPYEVVMGHVDHQLRRSSAADATFVRKLARRWDIPFQTVRVSIPRAAKKTGIEEAARNLRYRALVQMARRGRCKAILTAHTADDQAETVLMNYFRGAGALGLAGIPAHRVISGISVIRPLLGVSKKEIMQYLADQHLTYRTDPTNRHLRFTRNRIRHVTLPLLEQAYPGFGDRLRQAADIFREEEDFWSEKIAPEVAKTARKNGMKVSIDLTRLFGYHKALGRRILRALLPGLPFQDIERLFSFARSSQAVGPMSLSGGLHVKKTAHRLLISRGTHE